MRHFRFLAGLVLATIAHALVITQVGVGDFWQPPPSRVPAAQELLVSLEVPSQRPRIDPEVPQPDLSEPVAAEEPAPLQIEPDQPPDQPPEQAPDQTIETPAEEVLLEAQPAPAPPK